MERQVTFVARTLSSWIPKNWTETDQYQALSWDRDKAMLTGPGTSIGNSNIDISQAVGPQLGQGPVLNTN